MLCKTPDFGESRASVNVCGCASLPSAKYGLLCQTRRRRHISLPLALCPIRKLQIPAIGTGIYTHVHQLLVGGGVFPWWNRLNGNPCVLTAVCACAVLGSFFFLRWSLSGCGEWQLCFCFAAGEVAPPVGVSSAELN